MADIGINSLEDGRKGCDALKGASQLVDAARGEVASSFAALKNCDPDLGSHFIEELTKSLDDIYIFISGNLYPSADSYFQDEPKDEPITVPWHSGGGGGGGGGGGIQPDDPTPETVPEVVPETVPETVPEPESPVPSLEELDLTSFEESFLSDIKGLTDEMINLSKQENKKIDELLADVEKSDLLKKLLLESPNVPQLFKNTIENLNSNVVRLILDYILKGNRPEVFDLNTLNIGIVYEYLRQVAEQNGISINDLLQNPLHNQLLRNTLESFNDVIELIKGWDALVPEEFQSQLKDFYLGDVSEEFPDEDIFVTRAFVDYLADECDVSYEELINDSSYAETLKEGAVQFGKSLTFFNSSAFFTDEGMRNNVTSLFNGSNYKAYGMDKDTVESFRNEIDSLASQNNTTSDELLSNQAYADQVKDALANSSSAKGVGSIFKNAESTVSQEVAKNLYNTSFEKSSQQQEIDDFYSQMLKADEQKTQEVPSTISPEEKQKQAMEEAKKQAEEHAKVSSEKAAEEARRRGEENARRAAAEAKEKNKDVS